MSCTVKGLLDCAEYNLAENSMLGGVIVKLAQAQIKQYKDLKEAGADDEDDVNDALEKYPHCQLKLD